MLYRNCGALVVPVVHGSTAAPRVLPSPGRTLHFGFSGISTLVVGASFSGSSWLLAAFSSSRLMPPEPEPVPAALRTSLPLRAFWPSAAISMVSS